MKRLLVLLVLLSGCDSAEDARVRVNPEFQEYVGWCQKHPTAEIGFEDWKSLRETERNSGFASGYATGFVIGS